MALRTFDLDLSDRGDLRNRGDSPAGRKEDPRSCGVDWPDRAFRGSGCVRADRSDRPRPPRGLELSLRHLDVLRHRSFARGRHAALRIVAVTPSHLSLWDRYHPGRAGPVNNREGNVFRVDVDSLAEYFNFDPRRKADLQNLDKIIRSTAPGLKRY